MSMQLWSYVTGGMPGLILSAGYAIVLVYGGRRVIVGTLSLGTFVGFMAYYMRLFQPVQAMMGLYTSFATVKVSLGRVYELLDTRPDVVDPLLPVALGDVALGDIAGEVALRNITVDLGRGPILKSISLIARPGQTVAIVGPSGSGKSTIADLLVRLIDPDQGVVSLDGCDLKRLSLADLRRQVALVDQTPILFHASIAENIRYARPDASSEEIADVARAAGVDEIVARLPEGIDTVVGERGAALSAGERQRVALARALLLNPKVLVLDEPTAALDPAMEQQVLDGYERIMRGRTTILITHHVALASRADHVIVLGDKGIIEQGKPEELRAIEGAFAELSAPYR
jgi:ATP-binding cassette subfamily B protein